jgi:hypothetical protein
MPLSTRPLVAVIAAAAIVVTAAAPAAARTHRAAGFPGCSPSAAHGRTADFNGDGRPDLAIGAPYANVAGKARAGAVIVAYGGPSGLGSGGLRVVSQATPDVDDEPEVGDHFGWSLAVGDLDCDGTVDLAVGVPGEDHYDAIDLGGVNILYGSPTGLVGREVQSVLSWVDDAGPAQSGSRIGASLAVLDSNVLVDGSGGSDGFAELAVGAPGPFLHPGGGVFVLSGQFINGGQGGSGRNRMITFAVSDGSQAGASLAAGDIDTNATDDLIVGIPGADTPSGNGPVRKTGALGVVLNGGSSDVWLVGEELPGKPRAGDRLGSSVAVGDVNRDGIADIVAGMPGRAVGGAKEAGAVVFIPSKVALGGPDTNARVIVHQDSPGILGSSSAGDRFGASVAVGNLGRGKAADIAVGIPGEAVSGRAGAGAVAVLYGGFTSFGAADEWWHQASPGVPDAPESGDAFGSAVSIAQLGAGSPSDLAIGVPLEDVASTIDAGGSLVLFGRPDGLKASGAKWFTRTSVTQGRVNGKARFGFAVR